MRQWFKWESRDRYKSKSIRERVKKAPTFYLLKLSKYVVYY